MGKKKIFHKDLLIDYALDLNNISREQQDFSVEERKLIDKIEVNINNIFDEKTKVEHEQ